METKNGKVKLLALVAILAILLWSYIGTLPDGKLHLYFCNVGQGDAILIRTPQGQDFVIDGGPDNEVLMCLGRSMPFFDRTIEGMIATHAHADHIAGLISILNRYQVMVSSDTGYRSDTDAAREYARAVHTENGQYVKLRAGSYLVVDNLRMDVLWPKDGLEQADVNDQSTVLLLTYGNFRAFLPGDAGNATWEQLLPSWQSGAVTVLKVPHHGSRTGMNEQLLVALAPRLAILSSGADNQYGHPHQEALTLLGKYTVPLLRTDSNGTIEVITDGERWDVKTHRY